MAIKTRVLIVDDEVSNIYLLKEMLNTSFNEAGYESQYESEIATNGNSALELMPIFRPDIILLDIMMPGIDGYEVCRRIRTDTKYQFVKILMISGKSTIEERLKGYKMGADDYVTKPFDEDELLAKINVFKRLKRSEEVECIKSDLLKLFAHEIKTPLNAISGAAQLFTMDIDLKDEQKEMLKIMTISINELIEFTEKAFFLCKLKTNIDMFLIEFELHQLFNELLLKMKTKYNDVELIYHGLDNDLIVADWALLEIAFNNIIINCLDYSNQLKKLEIDVEKENHNYYIHIIEQGFLSKEWIDRMFNEFSVQDINHHHRGFGIDLSIARLIIENHKGSIQVSSDSEKGTRLTCILPIEIKEY